MNDTMDLGEALFAWILQTSWQAGVLTVIIALASLNSLLNGISGLVWFH